MFVYIVTFFFLCFCFVGRVILHSSLLFFIYLIILLCLFVSFYGYLPVRAKLVLVQHMHVCTCMYVQTNACANAHTHIHMHTYMHTHMHTHTCTCTCIISRYLRQTHPLLYFHEKSKIWNITVASCRDHKHIPFLM